MPLVKYRRYVTDDLAPEYVDDEIAVLGVNTARSLTFKDGRINAEQIAALRARMQGLDDHITRVIVTHHPFDLPDTFDKDDLVDRAPLAMAMFAECGVDLLLAGHLHESHAGNSSARYPLCGYAALVVQAGTATSTRGRGEANSFNRIEIDRGRIVVHRYSWDEVAAAFVEAGVQAFARVDDLWTAAES
jgi:3',5'-cyclic AMP phosphodiesterase CpdA